MFHFYIPFNLSFSGGTKMNIGLKSNNVKFFWYELMLKIKVIRVLSNESHKNPAEDER